MVQNMFVPYDNGERKNSLP